MKDLHKYLTKIPKFVKLPIDAYEIDYEGAQNGDINPEVIINIEKISCIFSSGPELTRVFLDTGAGANYGFHVNVLLPQKKVQKIIEMAHYNYHYSLGHIHGPNGTTIPLIDEE